MPKEPLGEILIRAGLLDQTDLQRALKEQQRWGGPLGRYLVDLNLIDEEILVRALSTQYKIPAVALDPAQMNIEVAKLIPKEICERYRLICFRSDPQKNFLDVAIVDPSSMDAINEVRIITGRQIRPYIAGPATIDRAITHVFYGEVVVGGEIDLASNPDIELPPIEDIEMSEGKSKESKNKPPSAEQEFKHSAKTKSDMSLLSGATAGPADRDRRKGGKKDSGFHITMDLSDIEVDNKLLAKEIRRLEDRLMALEESVERDKVVLQFLMDALVKKGTFSLEELRRLIGS